jgi:hypothetical protein
MAQRMYFIANKAMQDTTINIIKPIAEFFIVRSYNVRVEFF